MTAFWNRLRNNWFRNLLAVLQVALAIAAVTAVLVDVMPVLRDTSTDDEPLFELRYGVRTGSMASFTSVFRAEDVNYLLENSTTIEAATVYDFRGQSVVRVDDDRYIVGSVAYTMPDLARMADLDLLDGSFISAADTTSETPRVAVVSDELARVLFGTTDVVGRTLNLRPETEVHALLGFGVTGEARAEAVSAPGDDVEIIGVFGAPIGGALGGFGFGSADMFLPVGPSEGARVIRSLGSITIKPRPGMERAAEEEASVLLTSLLEERGDTERMDGQELGILAEPVLGADALRQARLSNALIVGALGIAALVVSSIAMFTTTLANLAQRTRYIGLSRSLGATRARVVREIVTETALLAGVGGIVGVVLAFPLRATILSPLFDLGVGTTGFGFTDVVLTGLAGVALAVVVGAVAGLYPAWTVARMAPAQAWQEGHM